MKLYNYIPVLFLCVVAISCHKTVTTQNLMLLPAVYEEKLYIKYIGADNPKRFYLKNGFLPHIYNYHDEKLSVTIKFVGYDSVSIEVYPPRPRISITGYYQIHYEDSKFILTKMYLKESENDGNHNHQEHVKILPSMGDTIFTSKNMDLLWINDRFYK